jgi:ubiquinone/menaquinone biosynthesis C-methylase UbiE
VVPLKSLMRLKGMVRKAVSGTFVRFSSASRAKKMALLEAAMPGRVFESVLDIGGEIDPRNELIVDKVADKSRVTMVNIDPQHLELARRVFPDVCTEVADARSLRFADKSFDLVFSNAVIEHVGGREQQALMAKEVQRVGRTWFVTTPNRWYPFEFHLRLPFASWLGPNALAAVAARFSYNHVNQRYQANPNPERLHLLTARQLRRLFPDSEVIRCRVTFWPETLVVVGPRSALRRTESGRAGRGPS